MKKEDQDFTKETQSFWKEHRGMILSDEESSEMVENLSGFFDILSEWERKKEDTDD